MNCVYSSESTVSHYDNSFYMQNYYCAFVLQKFLAIYIPYSLEITPPSIISPPLLFAEICCGGIYL